MAGIYLHIPFCRQACTYCNFHFTTSLRYKDDLVAALLQEMELRKNYTKGEEIATVYFGGGTPSLLTMDDCRRITDKIRAIFPVAANAEITLEANPDDIHRDNLQGWKEAGINRLSIGIQSFFEEDLRWMNRAHSAAQAKACIEAALLEGFHNLSIDLIYGSPGLTDTRWRQNVETALRYGIPHLSCYALTVEERTPLHKQISLKKKEGVDSDQQAHQFLLLMQWLRENGYEHYEVSNFARPGWRSRHNSSYWRGETYLGLGPSAHSFDGGGRQWNVANNQVYINSIQKGVVPREMEVLTPQQQLNEYIMISLRTKEGINPLVIQQNWGAEKAAALQQQIRKYQHRGLLTVTNGNFCLTDDGMLVADGIAADLFSL